MAAAAARPTNVDWRLRPLSLVVLAVLGAASFGAFVLSDRLVDDQEQRLLSERASEAGLVLSSAFGTVESSLRVLGPIGASPEPAARDLFERSAGPLVAQGGAVWVAADGTGVMTVVSAAGDGPEVGAPLSGERGALATRAQAAGALVADLVSEEGAEQGTRRLVLARPVEGFPAVAFQEATVDPAMTIPSTPETPYYELKVALYASTEADPDRLLISTETDVPLTGSVERVPFSVGADQWLLAVAARQPLTGSFAQSVPWLLLGGFLVTAALATAITETLARRRAYALALVGERTGELETAMADLREAKSFVDRIMTALPVLVTRFSVTEQRLTYVSANADRLFGFTPEEALVPGFLKEQIHPEDWPAVEACMVRIVADGTQEALEYRYRRADGRYLWESTVGVPEIDDAGRVVGIFGYAWDVSDRRQAEEAQRQAQGVAEAANQSKSEFLSRMSHELRTPLNSVLGFGQLLEIEPLTPAQGDAVHHILKGGRHLLGLINEVLDISRIEAGELSLSPEPVLASELVGEAVDLIRPLADQRGIQVLITGSAEAGPYVFADRQRVKQVLLNLLSNAVKYNRPRGTVAVSCEDQAGTRVRISVIDTGVGIPTERIGLLFTPFERLGAENTGEEGTGIGLALSKRLTEAMGGVLVATSTLGQGSTFTLELPWVEGPVERYERLNGWVHPAASAGDGRKVVLHIEDNLSNLTLVERILEHRADVEVVAAMHGRLGLELAREHQPSLVLLDLHLPDMGGEEVLQRLRDDPATASIPVVIVSADATPGQVQRLLSAGGAAYLTKPIDVRELLRILDEALVDR